MFRQQKWWYRLAVGVTVSYLIWRVGFTLPWNSPWWVLILAVLLVVVDFFDLLTGYAILYLRRSAAEEHLEQHFDAITFPAGQAVPAVDLVILVRDESISVVRKTFNAAVALEYPANQRVRLCAVTLTHRTDIQALAAEYQVEVLEPAVGQVHTQEEALNAALAVVEAPYIGFFTANIVPYSTFLTATVPLFMHDADPARPLGFVQTPQSYYNSDLFQYNLFSEKLIPNEQDHFSQDINIVNSMHGSAVFTGSNALFRRAAIDALGRIDADTATSEFELGAQVNLAGYRSYALDEMQASGVAPSGVHNMIQQRDIWARGAIQAFRNLKLFRRRKQLPFRNWLVLWQSYNYWWAFVRRLAMIAAIIAIAGFDVPLIDTHYSLLLLFWGATYLLNRHVWRNGARLQRNEGWVGVQQTFFAPYLTWPILSQFLGLSKAPDPEALKQRAQANSEWHDKLYVIPYIILWSLVVYSLYHFNTNKTVGELLTGAVITLWLFEHLINLSFCLFISSGRNITRETERIERHVPGYVHLGHADIHLQTQDVSEGGMLFTTPEYLARVFQEGQPLTVNLMYHDEVISLDGVIVRVSDSGQRGWRYALSLVAEDQNTDQMNRYMHLIYDGYHQVTSDGEEQWITPLDELYVNLSVRLKNMQDWWNERFGEPRFDRPRSSQNKNEKERS